MKGLGFWVQGFGLGSLTIRAAGGKQKALWAYTKTKMQAHWTLCGLLAMGLGFRV